MIISEMCTGLNIIDNDGIVLDINPAAADMLSLFVQQLAGVRINSIDTLINKADKAMYLIKSTKKQQLHL